VPVRCNEAKAEAAVLLRRLIEHARRLIEAAMLACWSPLEAVRAILVPGLFRKMPVVKRIMFADGESGN
jgi:hypothetical protein